MSSNDLVGSIFRHQFPVPAEAIDGNGHVNNVVYLQWMQDVAVMHSDAVGCTVATRAAGCTWVARTHTIEYLSPALAGDTLLLSTWVADFRRVRSMRHYEFHREWDGKLLARGQTDWVFLNVASGRPGTIPEGIRNCFELS